MPLLFITTEDLLWQDTKVTLLEARDIYYMNPQTLLKVLNSFQHTSPFLVVVGYQVEGV